MTDIQKLQAATEPNPALPPLARLRDALAAVPDEIWSRPGFGQGAIIRVGSGERNVIQLQGPEYREIGDLVMALYEARPGFEEAVERLAWIAEFCDEYPVGGEREWLRETKAFLARFKGAA